MLADGACAHATLRHMVELGFALAGGGELWQRALIARDGLSAQGTASGRRGEASSTGMTSATGTDAFLSIAGLLFPEFQWLFG